CRYEVGLADGDDQDIGAAAYLRHVRRAAVHQGNGTVSRIAVAGHQHCHRSADDVAAAYHDAVLANGVDVVAFQQFHNAVRGGRDEGGQPQAHFADVGGVEAVHVLDWINGERHFDFID